MVFRFFPSVGKALKQKKNKIEETRGLALTHQGTYERPASKKKVQFSVFANSLIKTIHTVPVVQTMQVRFMIQCLITVTISLVMRRQGKSVHFLGRPGHRWLLLCRALCFASALTGSWTALRLIPVGDSTIIVYLYPVFTGLLARQFLQESLGWSFWCQAGTCCVGVLLVTGAAFSQTSAESYKSYKEGLTGLFAISGFLAASRTFLNPPGPAKIIEKPTC